MCEESICLNLKKTFMGQRIFNFIDFYSFAMNINVTSIQELICIARTIIGLHSHQFWHVFRCYYITSQHDVVSQIERLRKYRRILSESIIGLIYSACIYMSNAEG